MRANRSTMARMSALALGGLLLGAPLAARAGQPTTAAEAQSRADHYTELANKYKLQGGVLYKTGNVQRAEMAASNCERVAEELRSGESLANTATGTESSAAAQPASKPHCPEP